MRIKIKEYSMIFNPVFLLLTISLVASTAFAKGDYYATSLYTLGYAQSFAAWLVNRDTTSVERSFNANSSQQDFAQWFAVLYSKTAKRR